MTPPNLSKMEQIHNVQELETIKLIHTILTKIIK